jgi:GT2 family glycosyltransferase
MLAISIVVHENERYLPDCLASLYANTRTPFEVYVTLNTGWREAFLPLREAYPAIHWITNDAPQGFAANHNHVLQLSQAEMIAILNDDLTLHEGALDKLVAYLEANADVGIVGPKLLNPDGTQQVSTYSDPTFLRALYRVSGLAGLTSQQSAARRSLQRLGIGKLVKIESLSFNNTVRDAPIIKGAVMLVRHAAYESVGGMDETTRMYGEEADWHLRMRRGGWRVVFYPDAEVTHYGQGQASLNLRGWLLTEDRKAILNYALKHRPRWQAETLRGFIIGTHSVYALLWLFANRERARDYWRVVRMAASFRKENAN